MTDTSLTLYSFWRSTAAYRVRVAARLKHLTLDERFIDLDTGEQHEPAFTRINPMAAVPALVIDAPEGGSQVLTESLAIIDYLDARFQQTPLWPADPADRAKAQAIAQTTAADIHPLIVPRIGAYQGPVNTSHVTALPPKNRPGKAHGAGLGHSKAKPCNAAWPVFGRNPTGRRSFFRNPALSFATAE